MLSGFASHRRSPKPVFCTNRARLIRGANFRFARCSVDHGERFVYEAACIEPARGTDAGRRAT
jgi:hypothetical protein